MSCDQFKHQSLRRDFIARFINAMTDQTFVIINFIADSHTYVNRTLIADSHTYVNHTLIADSHTHVNHTLIADSHTHDDHTLIANKRMLATLFYLLEHLLDFFAFYFFVLYLNKDKYYCLFF